MGHIYSSREVRQKNGNKQMTIWNSDTRYEETTTG